MFSVYVPICSSTYPRCSPYIICEIVLEYLGKISERKIGSPFYTRCTFVEFIGSTIIIFYKDLFYKKVSIIFICGDAEKIGTIFLGSNDNP